MSGLQAQMAVHHDPKMIGLWKVGRTLGRGFSGHVRIARHSKTGQYAAIKIIPKSSLGSRVSLNRLANEVEHSLLSVEREIVVMKLIDHPNVLRLYDVWETSSSIYLILEYVQGGELFDYLCSEGRRPVEEALDYFQQIICAVDYCHRFNITHRDLKLENILIDQNKKIKVADFGMAAWQDTSKGSLLRTSCGSPHYAAPEVISGKPYDGPAADIWSCGIILFALLVGKLPFDDDDCPALLQKIAIGKFDMPMDVDVWARDLISHMLNTDVTRRITMPDILRHPFFLSHPLKNPDALAPNRNIGLIAQRLTPRSLIDPDIFANLRTLWHEMSDSDLIEALTSPDQNWQKGIYHLLSNYRKKYLDSRREDEEAIQNRKRRKEQRQAVQQVQCDTGVGFGIPLRSGPPTPRRARRQENTMSYSTMSFVHVQKPGQSAPLISLSVPSPEVDTPVMLNLDGDLSVVAAPDLEDEMIQAFFQQVANHLNVLQARTTSINSPKLNNESPPLLQLPEMPSTNLLLASRSANTADPFSRPPVDLSSIRPLSLRRKNDTLKSSNKRHAGDKENAHPFTESDLINRQSPLAHHTLKMMDNRGIETLEVTPVLSRKPPKVGNEQLLVSNSPASPHFSEAGSSFTTSSPKSWSAPKRWLDNVFKFKTATYTLLSLQDINTTRSECRRLLMELDLLVSIEDSEKLGVLKCRSLDPQGANHTQGLKSLKFRVEMQWPTPRLCHEGYLVSLHFIQEKGSLEAFKGIFQQVARNWSFDRPQKSLNLGLTTFSSSADEVFRY